MKKYNLFINLGNTNIVVGYCPTKNINDLKIHKFKTKEVKAEKLTIEEIFSLINQEIEIKKVFISSVVSSLNESFKSYFELNEINYKFIKHTDVPYLDLTNLYNPYELGMDLVAQMAYVSKFFEEAIVVSAGTALVIYHIKAGKLSGVIIDNGLSMAIKTLSATTDLQQNELVQTDKVFGFNTNEAISIGLINGVNDQIEQIKKKINNKDCPIVCSGGDAHYFNSKKWWFIEHLEILGLYTLTEVQ